MAKYSYFNKNTNEEFDEWHTISEMELYLESNPHIVRTLTKSSFVSGRTGVKPSDGFKDVLKCIQKQNPGNTIEI